jgi:hypothetical protein
VDDGTELPVGSAVCVGVTVVEKCLEGTRRGAGPGTGFVCASEVFALFARKREAEWFEKYVDMFAERKRRVMCDRLVLRNFSSFCMSSNEAHATP